MGVGMITIVVAILIVICGGGCIYKLCTSPCNACGWITSCASCCKKKQQRQLVLDDADGGDTGVAIHTSMESLRGEYSTRRALGNSASIFNAPHHPRPYTREHRSRSPLNRHKNFQAKRSPSMILERHQYAPKSKQPRSSTNACPSPTFSRHTVAGAGGLNGVGGMTGGFGTARFTALPHVSDVHGNVYEMRAINQSTLNLSQNLPSNLTTSDPASLNAPPSSRAESLLTLQGIIGTSSIGNPSNVGKKE